MGIKPLIFVLFVLMHFALKCQSITSEEAWCFHTTMEQCHQLRKQKQPEIILQMLQNVEPDFLKRVGKSYQNTFNTFMATIFAESGDTAKAYAYYLPTLIGNESQIKSLSNNESKVVYWRTDNHPFHFLYVKHKHTFDSMYSAYLQNTLLQNAMKADVEKIKLIMQRDQQCLKGGLELQARQKDSISISDSINLIEFICFIEHDTNGYAWKENFGDLLVLGLHLSRYDNLSYKKIIAYTIRIFGDYNFLIAMLADNRSFHLYNHSRYYDYLPKEHLNDNLYFAAIDKERRFIGQPSLYFTFLYCKLPIPAYYIENPTAPCY